jgi:N-methylhydantoinase A
MQADELGIREVVVPRTAPAFSALGLLLTEPVLDELRAYITPATQIDLDRVNALFAQMEAHAHEALSRQGSAGRLTLNRFAELCYPGQTFEMAVPAVATNGRLTKKDLEATIARFHDIHEELHTYASREEEPILRGLRLQAVGSSRKPKLPGTARARTPVRAALKGKRRAWFEGRFGTVPVYDGPRLRAGHEVKGPAIVEEPFTTVVVYPGQRLALDRHGNYRIAIA